MTTCEQDAISSVESSALSPRDMDLVTGLILKAAYLAPGEAFDLGGADSVIVARSNSGKLWIGHGGINSGHTMWWKKEEPYACLAESCRASLNVRTQGYFARDFRERCEYALSRPARRVVGVGRCTVAVDPAFCAHDRGWRRLVGKPDIEACMICGEHR